MERVSRERDWFAESPPYQDGLLVKTVQIPLPKNRDGSSMTYVRNLYVHEAFDLNCTEGL